MPTANRRRFVPQAIRYFLAQDYPHKELVVVDDGADHVADLMPDDLRVRYIRLSGRRTLGAKRNECVEASRGDLIMHWDDDDWMSPRRISLQAESLLRAGAEVCGVREMLFYEMAADRVWLYVYPPQQRSWLAGGSLLYTREFWRRSPFPNIQVASDTRFVWGRKLERAVALPDSTFYVAMIHPGNTSAKSCRGSCWKRWPGDLRTVMGDDLDFYRGTFPAERQAPPRTVPVAPVATVAPGPPPTYSIIMVAHNARAMTQMAVLRTLRHTAQHAARLVVVDNASSDGTQEWLAVMAERGDLDLIRSASNIGHGPGLELARRQLRAPYLVTLDSDAFPLADDWLPRLRARLDEGAKVAGVLHHRGYVHPSCLMIARETLEEYGLSFLNEKSGKAALDVGERISVEIKRRGGRIAGLRRTGAQRRGSASEPVYLGSEYEGIVYHQWYTTRAATIPPGLPVDDVPRNAIELSLREVLEGHQQRELELTVIVGVRSGGDAARERNMKACLRALNLQSLERWRYRMVVVEQDRAPRLEGALAPLADRYIFARNCGPYNRGWAFNIGAVHATGRKGVLCLMDADLLVPADFLRRHLATMQAGQRALLPYREVVYLDRATTERAIKDRLAAPHGKMDERRYPGRAIRTARGGCIWIDAGLYHEIGGHDERFQGWGAEDRDFWNRLSRAVAVPCQPDRLLHLDHARSSMTDQHARNNQRLRAQLAAGSIGQSSRPIGDLNLYASEANAAPARFGRNSASVGPGGGEVGQRECGPWHRWDQARIERIVLNEKKQHSSPRGKLASKLVQIGDSLLDVGCGPGALWLHLEPHRPRLSWTGVDVTAGMLAAARRLFPQVPVGRADAGALPFPEGSFDLVLLRHVIEHLPPSLQQKSISEAIRVARRAVVLDLFTPPRRLAADLEMLSTRAGWPVQERSTIAGASGETDEILIMKPAGLAPAPAQPLKISIIMPTYHRAHTIFRTIETIKAQTYADWELIVIDNAATGNYRFDDPRIRIYRHDQRIGSSYARNQGLQYVTGDAVCFFDDDDDMFPAYLEQFATALKQNPHARLVRCAIFLKDGRKVFGYGTQMCCLRREFATPTWTGGGPGQDNRYYHGIIAANRWSEARGDIVVLPEAMCRANGDPVGGLRLGRY